MTTSSGGGEGRWPFERVNGGAGTVPPTVPPTVPAYVQPSVQPSMSTSGPVIGGGFAPRGVPTSNPTSNPPSTPTSFPPATPMSAPPGGSTGFGVYAGASGGPVPATGAAGRPVSRRDLKGGAQPPAPTPSAGPSGFGVYAGAPESRGLPPAHAGGPPSRRDLKGTQSRRRRPPLWLLILIGVVVIAGAVVAVLLLTGKDEPEAPPAATVTLPAPTPTIDAISREPGTAFYDALPSEVLQFALTEAGADTSLMVGGALEAYHLVYSDGATATLTVTAGQWADAAGVQAYFDSVLAAATAELGEIPEADAVEDAGTDSAGTAADDAPDDTDDAADTADGTAATATPTEEPLPSPVQGPVEVDGQEVGRFLFVPRADGTGTISWTNSTVFVTVVGPWTGLRDVFRAYPL